MPPIKVGPKKLAAIAIKDTRAIPTDGAIPGTLMAARLNAGKNGPIHNPVTAKPIQRIETPTQAFTLDNGIPIIKLMPSEMPAM